MEKRKICTRRRGKIIGIEVVIRMTRDWDPFEEVTEERQPLGKLTLLEFPATLVLSVSTVPFHLAILCFVCLNILKEIQGRIQSGHKVLGKTFFIIKCC